LGTPPEDDAGAGEGAPATATDPAKSDRVNALASRIDAFITAGDDEDERAKKADNGQADEPKLLGAEPNRLASEPGADMPLASADERDAREAGSEPAQKRLVRLQSEPVDLDDDEPSSLELPPAGSGNTLSMSSASDPPDRSAGESSESSGESTGGTTSEPQTTTASDASSASEAPSSATETPSTASEPSSRASDARTGHADEPPATGASTLAGEPPIEPHEDSAAIEVSDDEVQEISRVTPLPVAPAPTFKGPPIPPPRAIPPPPPRGGPPRIPPAAKARPPAIPPRTPAFGSVVIPPMMPRPSEPAIGRTPTEDRFPPPPPPPARSPSQEFPTVRPGETREPKASDSQPKMSVEDMLAPATDITTMEGGVEVGTATPNVVVDQPLEAHLEHPTVVDKALAALGDAGGETRAEELLRELEATVLGEPIAAAQLAYELGEHYERRLADEARAIKAFSRALNLDPSLRPNLWAIRRVFYRRALWPNLQKLVDAEVEYARDDYERADLLLEQARISNHRLADAPDARVALDEAVRIAPQHQGVLLELERVAARSGDLDALLDVWERLAEAVEQPARKVAYWLEVGRTAAANNNISRAHEAFEKATGVATSANLASAAERVARERLRVAEEHGTPDDVGAAIDALAQVLLAAFGPAGPGAEPGTTAADERPTRATALRLELVALRRRQAQLARKDSPDKAWEYLQQAQALSPGEMIVLADLTELAEELGRYDELAELVQNWQAVEGDASRALTLSIRRADALLRGGQADQARALLASLEAAAPGFIVLTSAAERDALRRGDPRVLAETYLAAAHAALLGTWLGPGHDPKPDPAAAAALYVQGAELLAYEVAAAETPEIYEEARAALGKALEAVPDHAAAVEALIELDDTTGNLVDALTRLRGLLERADDDIKRSLLERAVRLARSHGDLEALLEFQRKLVELVPDEMPLRWRLEATLAQLGRDDERTELLTRIAADEPDATGRGTALLAAARLRERTGAVEAAAELYREVLLLWPDDTFARESLLDLLRAQEKWSELVAERRAEAKTLPDGPAARRALREAAWVLEVRLDDAAQAAQIYDEWLARIPDDRAALDGLARCRAKFGDRNGEATTRGTIAETAPSPNALWLHARSLEQSGQLDEAAEIYRTLIASEEPSIAATNAAFALADIAAQRSDTIMRVEAMAALAGRTSDARLGAALAEDSGWLYALVLEDHDRAAQSFEAAIALDPTRRGAQLGAALIAARRAEPGLLAHAYEGLAASVQMPEAAAALLLRAAAVAAANGDLELANQRVATARNAAPDDTSALLVNAETAVTPHVDGQDAFAAVDPLLARAELLEMRSALADDAAARASWELDRAEALELAGRMREAGAVVAAVLKTTPDDLRGLSALRRMAMRVGDKSTAGSAAYSLARVIGDRQAKLDLLREAVAVFDGPGMPHNTDYSIAAYRRILANDAGAAEFDRLLELLRERADVRTLIDTITERLMWHESEGHAVEFTVPLLLERATVLHGLGEIEAAMADLDALLERSPRNVEALRFRADIAFNAGDVESAVALWRRYLQAETRPGRRGEIELQLAQVLAENTNDVAGAIEQMERVCEAHPEDVALRERLLGLCLRASDWERAVRELRSLARMRPTPQERAREELRLGLMLRDRLGDRAGARMALDRARTLDPINLDVVRELVELLDPAARGQMLHATTKGFRDAIVQNPKQSLFYEKLAQVSSWESDVDGRWVALVAVEALGTPSVDQRQVLTQGRQQLRAPNRVKLDDAERRSLRGSLGGPLHDLWRAIAPAVQAATGVDVGKLGFVRGDRVAQKKLGDKYEPLATALAAFGVDDVDIYINAGRTGVARALAADTPILCVGADVASAAAPHNRFLLGRVVATIAEGVATLPELRDGELAWTIAAALRAVDAPVPAALVEHVVDDETSIAERAKVLKKEINRRAKSAVQELARSKADQLGAVDDLKRAALAVGHRAGLLWCGDLGVALSVLDVGRTGRSITDSNLGLELTAWSVSEDHLRLREKLGLRLGAR
jgi:tetratricopeptide (TPR) repeat protein